MSKYPPDWEIIQLGEKFSVSRGDGNLTKNAYRKTGFPAFSASGQDGFVEEFQNEGEGIIISSVGAQCGKIFKASGKWTAINNTIFITENNPRHSIDYLYHFLDLQDTLLSEGGAQPFISQKEVVRAKLHFPLLTEQKRIAEILTQLDIFKNKLNLKLEKIKQLSHAVALNILGISEEFSIDNRYKHFHLVDCLTLSRGVDLTRKEMTLGDYPVMASSGEIGEHCLFTCKSSGVTVGRKGSIGKVYFIDRPHWVHDTSLGVTDFKGNNKKYIFYLLKYLRLEKYGTASGSPSLNRNDLYPIKVNLVLDKNLQASIVNKLDSFENYKSTLLRKINHINILKKGICRELLSGRKRVKV